MARIVVQYPLQDLGMQQRAIEERRGHGYDSSENEGEQVRHYCWQAAAPNLSIHLTI